MEYIIIIILIIILAVVFYYQIKYFRKTNKNISEFKECLPLVDGLSIIKKELEKEEKPNSPETLNDL